jgi:hypothetical protein
MAASRTCGYTGLLQTLCSSCLEDMARTMLLCAVIAKGRYNSLLYSADLESRWQSASSSESNPGIAQPSTPPLDAA